MLSRGLTIPYCWGKTQPHAPWIIGSPVWLVVAGTTSALCETRALFPLTLLDSSFPSIRYFPHMYALTCTLIEYSTGTWPCISRILRAHLSFAVFCPANNTLLGLSAQLRESLGLFLGYIFPGPLSRSFLNAESSGDNRTHLFFPLSLREYCPLLPDVHCHNNHCFIHFVFFGGEGVLGRG